MTLILQTIGSCEVYRRINFIESPKARVLFLGYNETETQILGALVKHGCEVWHTTDKVQDLEKFDLVISFGYRRIIKFDFISLNPPPIVNLHISYLPWNRGAHPNFWSFFDSTPSGVSIHLIDEGIDTGPILFQRLVKFEDKNRTFSDTYKQLTKEIESLFIENIEAIIDRSYRLVSQPKGGSLHRKSELPEAFRGWDSVIEDEILRLKILASNEK